MEEHLTEPAHEEIAKVLDEIQRDVAMIHIVWSEVTTLFTDSGTIDLLNATSRSFFSHVRRIFPDDIMMSISRLTDPATQGGKANLTFELLIEMVDDVEVKRNANALFAANKAYLAPIRAHRNKRLSHSDLPTRMEQASALSSVDIEQITRTLQVFDEVIYLIGNHYFSHPYSIYSGGPEGAARLLQRLQEGS